MEGWYNKYIELIGCDKSRGGNMELIALARGHGCPVKRMPPQVSTRDGEGAPVSLWYDEDARHYESLKGSPSFNVKDEEMQTMNSQDCRRGGASGTKGNTQAGSYTDLRAHERGRKSIGRLVIENKKGKR